MRAVVAKEYGGPEGFALIDMPDAMCGPGEVRVDIHAAGVSFVDGLIAVGRYQLRPPLPFIPGSEFAGIVCEAGEGSFWRAGDRVAGSALCGAFAEQIVVDASRLHPLPDSMSLTTGAIFRVGYATAYHALKQRAAMQSGETVLVLGAAGSVGYAAVQLAKAMGGRVIAAASSAEKRAAARDAGADAVIAADATLRAAMKVACPDGVDIVVDPVSGDLTEAAFRSLRWGGRHLVIGFATGRISQFPANLALLKGAALVGVDVRQFREREPAQERANLDALFSLYADGRINPLIRDIMPLSCFADAMTRVAAGTCGRILLKVR